MEGSSEFPPHDSEQERSKENYRFQFSQNESLLKLSDYISSTEPDWERMIRVYQATNRGGYKPDVNNLPGELLEVHLKILLHDFAKETGKLDLDPISDGYRTKDVFFERHPRTGGWNVVNLRSLLPQSEKDAVFRADGLLTVVEVKNTKSRTQIYRRKNKRSALSDAIRPEATNQELQPYVDAFGLPLGYIVLTMPEAISKESLLQEDFKKNGGLIISFNTNYKEFRDRAFQAYHNRIA